MGEETTTTVEEVAPVETSEATVDEITTSDRPEWLPEKFNDPSELGKAYKELESKLGQKEEDIKSNNIRGLVKNLLTDIIAKTLTPSKKFNFYLTKK